MKRAFQRAMVSGVGILAAAAMAMALGACGSSKPGGGSGPDGGGSGTGTGTGSGDGGGTGSATGMGCDGATLLANPSDPKARGPWPVGVKTAMVGRLTVEVWYPAMPGSDTGKEKARYDIRAQLPASERSKISDTDNPWQDCDCVRDLPIDGAHGPYPVVVFVHGTAAFRHQSLPIVTHWASRGFVVIAADHPGLKLGDFLGMVCNQPASGNQDLSGDIDAEIAAIGSPSGDLGFLAGHVDATRIAVAGHSAGANAAASAATKPNVRVVIPMAGNQAAPKSSTLASTLFLGGESDMIVSYGSVKGAWTGSPSPRRLVEIANAGHLVFSDLCQIKNAAGMDILHVAQQDNVCGANLAGFLFDCKTTYIDGPTGWDITDYASSTVLESTLQCAQGLPDLANIQQVFPDVKAYLQAL